MKAAYLLLYNNAMLVGWLCAVVLAGLALGHQQFGWRSILPVDELSHKLTLLVCVLQATATLEIVHSALGLVTGSPVSALIQNLGRDAVLFLFILPIKESQSNFFCYFLYATWGMAEVIRDAYYISMLKGECPEFLKMLRYSAFLILYPMGFVGELACIYIGYSVVVSNDWYSMHMPNQLNLEFNFKTYWSVHTLLGYALGAPYLYYYMLQQRKKQLKPKSS